MGSTCHAVRVPATQWDFCPSIAAAYLFAILFSFATIIHLAQALVYRKVYCWTIIMGNLLQTVAYVLRILSIQTPASLGLYSGWFVLIAIAPVWINAFVYMVMGRMVWNFTATGKLGRLSAWRYGQVFVALDVLTLVIQLYGAATAANTHASQSTILRGIHTYMGGLGVQQLFICAFLYFAMRLHKILRATPSTVQQRQAVVLLYVQYVAITLITGRIIFRLIEYSDGLHSSIPRHEAYQYCLDSLFMLVASTLYSIVHPGRIMPGIESDLPTKDKRKEQQCSSQRSVDSVGLTGLERN